MFVEGDFGGILVGWVEQNAKVGRNVAMLLPVVGITKADILSPFVVAVRSGLWNGRGFNASSRCTGSLPTNRPGSMLVG